MTGETAGEPERDVLMRALAHWPRTLILVVVGAVIGLLVAFPRPDTVTVEARLAVGSNDLAAYQIAGFAVGSEALAANYARFSSDSPTIRSLLADKLGSTTSSKIKTVVSSPIPDSNVVRVEVSSVDQKAATEGAQTISDFLVAETADKTAAKQAALLKQHRLLSLEVVQLQASIAERGADAKTEKSSARLANLLLEQTAVGVAYQQSLTSASPQSSLRIIEDPTVTGRSGGRQKELYAVLGAILGFVLAIIAASGRVRLRRRSPRAAQSG